MSNTMQGRYEVGLVGGEAMEFFGKFASAERAGRELAQGSGRLSYIHDRMARRGYPRQWLYSRALDQFQPYVCVCADCGNDQQGCHLRKHGGYICFECFANRGYAVCQTCGEIVTMQEQDDQKRCKDCQRKVSAEETILRAMAKAGFEIPTTDEQG